MKVLHAIGTGILDFLWETRGNTLCMFGLGGLTIALSLLVNFIWG